MLPEPSKFCAAMRYFGIKRDDHVVCYDNMGFWTTARGAWTLKVRLRPSPALLFSVCTLLIYSDAEFTYPRHVAVAVAIVCCVQVYGHENVSVLDGGPSAWKAAGYEIESGPVRSFERSNYPYMLPNERMIKRMSFLPFLPIMCFTSPNKWLGVGTSADISFHRIR